MNNKIQLKKLNELVEVGKNYKVTNIQSIDSKYGNQISVILDNDRKILLTYSYAKLIKKSDLKIMNQQPVYNS